MKEFFEFNDYIINNIVKNGEFPNNEFIEFLKKNDAKYIYIKSRIRNAYCSNVSWAFLTKDFINEVNEKFKELKIKKVIDVFGGTGAFSYYIKKTNPSIDIVSYTVEQDGYFNILTKMKEKNKERGLLKTVKKHTEFYELIKGYDCIIASWIPYDLEDAEKLLIKMDKEQYILVITEGKYGCIANDKFHDLLEDENMFKLEYKFKNLMSFEGIYDKAYLYKKIN